MSRNLVSLHIRLTQEQKAAIDAAAETDRVLPTTWARETLLRAAGRPELGALGNIAVKDANNAAKEVLLGTPVPPGKP